MRMSPGPKAVRRIRRSVFRSTLVSADARRPTEGAGERCEEIREQGVGAAASESGRVVSSTRKFRRGSSADVAAARDGARGNAGRRLRQREKVKLTSAILSGYGDLAVLSELLVHASTCTCRARPFKADRPSALGRRKPDARARDKRLIKLCTSQAPAPSLRVAKCVKGYALQRSRHVKVVSCLQPAV